MLAIVGGKGGCGKTTTAVALGRAFARGDERALLVDADCDTPNLHTVTETPYSPGVGAIAEGAPLSRAIHGSPVYPGLDVLPSGSRTGAVPPTVLDRVRGYSYPGRVLVDCPAGATSAVTTPVRAADAALLVTTPEPGSRRDAATTARLVRALGTPLLGAVLVGVREGDPVGPADPADSADRSDPSDPFDLGCRVLETVPWIEGSVLGDPVGQAAYDRLAGVLAERNP